MASRPRGVAPRAERILPGIWRLRLALPWPGVPHGNAWALAAGDGLVLFDTGMGGKGRLRSFELALAQVGFAVEDIDLVVCTHAHVDHYGLAAPITAAAECELWMHPAWEHIRLLADDPAAALEARLEVARLSGVPAAALESYRKARAEDDDTGVEAIREPDRELLPGVEVETDHGTWQVYETPGHAPSHVVLHQPESELMITGDHLLGRTVLFFDYGHTPDPVGEFLTSLEVVEPLGPNLCLPGHGKPFRDPEVKIAEARRQVGELRAKVGAALAGGERTAFDVVAEIVGAENLQTPTTGFLLQIVLAVLDNMAARGEVRTIDSADPRRWALIGS
ncbi:MAG: MBL fold metallo-hydrolase [Thermoleophilia bacterium]|nr:MBL fold metallo-hydrolase [Thermoleophilia bacterium]